MTDLTGTRALVLAANLFEEAELIYPVHRLREEGAEVVVASAGAKPVSGKRGFGPMDVDADIADQDAGDFDALVIPGGFAPDALRVHEPSLELVRAFDAAAKPIAFICHAGWLPISAGILKGRRATSVVKIRDDMVNAGVDWVDEPTVVDGHIITARTPADLGPWMRALLAALRAS